MDTIKSALLIDNNDFDNFINLKLLRDNGVTNVILFNEADNALTYLKATQVVYQLILIDICLPNAYRFVDNFDELGLRKTQGELILLTSGFVDSSIKEAIDKKNIRCVDKPLTIEKLRQGVRSN